MVILKELIKVFVANISPRTSSIIFLSGNTILDSLACKHIYYQPSCLVYQRIDLNFIYSLSL